MSADADLQVRKTSAGYFLHVSVVFLSMVLQIFDGFQNRLNAFDDDDDDDDDGHLFTHTQHTHTHNMHIYFFTLLYICCSYNIVYWLTNNVVVNVWF